MNHSFIKKLNLAVWMSALLVLVVTTPVSAAFTGVDASAQAGSRQDPHLEWTKNKTFPCNKYVQPGGAMSGNGAEESKWQSLKIAFRDAMPGDNVCVEGGIYRENNLVPGRSGTWAQPITFRNLSGMKIVPNHSLADADKAVIHFNNNTHDDIGYWAIDGFVIDRERRDGPGVELLGYSARADKSKGAIHHIIIQNLTISNGKAGQGILIRGRVHDTLLRRNTVENFRRWTQERYTTRWEYSDAQYSRVSDKHFRSDAHGISVEGIDLPPYQPPVTSQDPSPQLTKASVKRLYIDKSTFRNNGGDGLQCLGVDDSSPTLFDSDPMDIAIVDNKVEHTYGDPSIPEDGYDIKSCQHVTIAGTTLPTHGTPTSTINELRPTTRATDASGTTNNSDGSAIVLHLKARNVLVEKNAFTNVCSGVKIGRSDTKSQSIVVRNNLIRDLHYHQVQPGGNTSNDWAVSDKLRCRGTGLQITNVNHADIYNNTLSNIPKNAIQISDGRYTDPNQIPYNVDIWNNILGLRTPYDNSQANWFNVLSYGSFDSNYNLFWHPSGGTNRFAIDGGQKTFATWTQQRDMALSSPDIRVGNPSFTPTLSTAAGSIARDTGVQAPGSIPAFCGAKPDRGVETCQ